MLVSRKFDPIEDGLPYENGKFKFKTLVIFNCSVLCGGISYTALDYFETGIAPPKSSRIPVEGNPMEEYLYRRQETAHFYTWHRFAAAWSGDLPILRLPISPIVTAIEQDTLEDLCKYVANRPVIICLFGGPFVGHHVVATACNPVAKEILLYDCNYPGKTSFLKQLSSDPVSPVWLHRPSGYRWRGWFMDWGHYSDGTRMPPLAFRFCRTCHLLNTESLAGPGGCVIGSHNNAPEFEYFLPWKAGEGQGGWSVCGKCKGLFRATGTDVPFCPAGGMHFVQTDNSNWKEVHVLTNGSGESGWRRCTSCTSLFFGGNASVPGKCSLGDSHTAAANEAYTVDCRTI